MDSGEADEVVFNSERNRIESVPISKVPTTTLFKPFCCPTFGETLTFSRWRGGLIQTVLGGANLLSNLLMRM